MAILARIPATVHLVVAKRAAQARGIINLINSAQSGRPIPVPLSRSNPYLNQNTPINRLKEDDTEDDDDDSDDGGARFGSRVSLGDAASQNSVSAPYFKSSKSIMPNYLRVRSKTFLEIVWYNLHRFEVKAIPPRFCY